MSTKKCSEQYRAYTGKIRRTRLNGRSPQRQVFLHWRTGCINGWLIGERKLPFSTAIVFVRTSSFTFAWRCWIKQQNLANIRIYKTIPDTKTIPRDKPPSEESLKNKPNDGLIKKIRRDHVLATRDKCFYR